ncbi:hypothetical protein, partial [Thermocatellispora tengchongensis]|uniref:hypothetical protein n=1 Tax=Thermocatellispora tengchongensis TaxID=1073253 RepID=UPI001C8553DD
MGETVRQAVTRRRWPTPVLGACETARGEPPAGWRASTTTGRPRTVEKARPVERPVPPPSSSGTGRP